MEKYIFDIVVLALMLLIVFLSAKKGFAKTVLDAISVSVGFFTAYKFSPIVSDFVYNNFIGVFVEKSFMEIVGDLNNNSSAEEKISAMTATLPEGLVAFSESLGVDSNLLINSVLKADISSDELLVKAFSDNLVYGLLNYIIEFIAFVLIFVVVSIALKLVSLLFSKTIENLPIIGTANYILGGVLGAVKAIVVLFVVFSVGYFVIIAMNIEPSEYISQSYTYQYIMKNNPIIVLIQG